MALGLRAIADRLLHRRKLRSWGQATRRAQSMDLSSLRALRTRARQIRRRIDQLLLVADSRLTRPYLGSDSIPKPLHCDWAYRPELWRGPVTPQGLAGVENKTAIGQEATIHHDCRISELTVRQLRNSHETDLAPFGLRLEVFRFDGSFLSLVIDLPTESATGLKRRHLVRLTADIKTERKAEVFARLNVRHGPNTEKVVRELHVTGGEVSVEFDLSYTELNEKRVERMWVDLIFEGPEMNRIDISDITLTRRPRAEF